MSERMHNPLLQKNTHSLQFLDLNFAVDKSHIEPDRTIDRFASPPLARFRAQITILLQLLKVPWLYVIMVFDWLFPSTTMDEQLEDEIEPPKTHPSQITDDYHLIGKYKTPLVLPEIIGDENLILEFGSATTSSSPPSNNHEHGSSMLRLLALEMAQKRTGRVSKHEHTLVTSSPQDVSVQPSPVHYGTMITEGYSDHDRHLSLVPSTNNVLYSSADTADEDHIDIDSSLIIDMETVLNSPQPKVNPPSQYVKTVLDFYLPDPIAQYSAVDSIISSFQFDRVSTVYDKERDAIQQSIAEKKQRDQSTAPVPLTKAQEAQVKLCWLSSRNRKLVSKYDIDIFDDDLKTLRCGRWLNDNIIDFYLNLVMEEAPDSYAWTTHFYSTLSSKGYQGVARWAKRRKLNVFSKQIVIVPINIHNTHWAVAVINNKRSTIDYIDSLSGSGNMEALIHIRDYMIAEAKRLGSAPVPDYTLNSNVKGPQQKNGFDCGVFTCMAAKLSAMGKPLQYSQSDMPIIRARMAYEILQKKLT